jgi:hypothetical protein
MTATKTRTQAGKGKKSAVAPLPPRDAAIHPDQIMAALDRATRESNRRGTACTAALFLERLPEDYKEAISALIDDKSRPASMVSRALRDLDGPAAYTIRRHRRRGDGDGCQCPA